MLRYYSAVVVLILILAASSAASGGGVYIDDLSITNGDVTVFSDSFDDGDVSDWHSMKDAMLSPNSSSSPASMHLNWHGGSLAQAFHSIAIASPGLIEASARVWLPPVQEQYNWSHGEISSASISLHSASSASNLYAGIELWPGETGYRLSLGRNEPGASVSYVTGAPYLFPDTWGLITMRVDPSASSARMYLDGIEQCIVSFHPQCFQSYDGISLYGNLGNGVTPEPSSLIILGSALPLLAGGLLRRRR